MTIYSNPYENITALVIDVNSSMRQIIASMLRNLGFKNIFIATNEVQARDITNIEKVALVFCGWQPGKLDGLRILEYIRQKNKTSSIPFLMVTDLIDQDLVRQAILNGVSEYIVPPFNKLILQNRIDRSLKMPIHSSAEKIIKKDSRLRFNSKSNTQNLNILVVDDVADNIVILRETLKAHYKIKAVTSGKSVMQICLSNQPPDIILLDIMMPEVDGLTLCKQLKQNPMTQNIVVIFITALSDADDVVKGLKLGAVDYITKPIQPSVVLARVQTHSKLVLSQRTIQNQIDELIQNNTKRNDLADIYQKQLIENSNLTMENIDFLETKLKSSSLLDRAFDQLKYSTYMNHLMVTNLLTLQQLESSAYKVNRSRKETSNFIKELIQNFNFEIREKNLEVMLKLECEVALFTDENLATYLLSLLINNAIRFSPRGSKIHIKTINLEEHILLSIQNIGEIDEKVKKTFGQLYAKSEQSVGSGIGVYSAFLAAKALHDELYYHSSEQYGTIFYLKFKK